MIRDIALPDIYRGKANLWVEDAITRVYLKECWQDDPDIFFLTAGGNDNVTALLKDALERGQTNVFGFRDRDFLASNYVDWLDPGRGCRSFVPSVHELENYLLDARALEGCQENTGKRTQAQIEARLAGRAGELLWWMACRRVISSLREQFVAGFLNHPKCAAITDLASAEICIMSHHWYAALRARTDAAVAAGAIQQALANAHTDALDQLHSGQWKREFSGKELFRDVRGWIHTMPPRQATQTEMDIDVARSVARWQIANNAVPAEVNELRVAVRQKAGLT